MSVQRAGSTIAPENRSAHPGIPGVPWWAAILIAVATTTAGAMLDAGGRELTSVFAVMYALGCVAAVLAVRQSAIFTAVVQPPLILFVAIPGANYFFHRAEIVGIKDVLINCGYPLIERFLLMFCTAVVVLLIGMARWYFGSTKRHPAPTTRTTAAAAKVAAPAAVAGFFAAFRSAVGGHHEPEAQTHKKPVRHGRTTPAGSAPRSPRERPAPTRRSRHARPPMDDIDTPASPPRRRHTETRGDGAAAGRYRPLPRERDPRERGGRPDYRGTYQPADHGEPPRRSRGGQPSTHHPVSNVRYRGAPGPGDDHDPWRPRDDRRR